MAEHTESQTNTNKTYNQLVMQFSGRTEYGDAQERREFNSHHN